MNRDFSIQIQLADAALRPLCVANVSIDAVLYLKGKMRYRFDAGRTNAQGCLAVTFDDIERLRLKNQEYSLMDYNTRLDECNDQISFVVPTLKELEQRRAAIQKWFPEAASESEKYRDSNNEKVHCKALDVDASRVYGELVFWMCDSCE
ncbi:MAG: hypothetical protein JSS44_08105 [Proteobacteria bacterium]|nr:hypothetical protein [Pseudomonadota bacterium]